MEVTPVKLLNVTSGKAHRKLQITKTRTARADRDSQAAMIRVRSAGTGRSAPRAVLRRGCTLGAASRSVAAAAGVTAIKIGADQLFLAAEVA
jgi:hypothetical protein